MGYKTKVQVIRRKEGIEQWYINFPSALAQAMDFRKGEVVEWVLESRGKLVVKRKGRKNV